MTSCTQAAPCSERRTTKRSWRKAILISLGPAGRRVAGHRAELYFWHHGQPQGRGHSSPRSIPERFVEHRIVGHAGTSGLSLDAAHVPLQWLVLSLDHGGDRRDECLYPAG